MLFGLWVFGLLLQVISVLSAITPVSGTSEAAHRRKVFWAGAQYVFNATLNGTILVNQMYAEQLTPVNGRRRAYPLVFVHGGGVSGTVCFEPI